jgi:putative redox protein
MKIQATWRSPMRFDGIAEGGTTVVMDGQPEYGGSGAGPSPMETVLIAMASCTGMDVASILAKMRAPLRAFAITIEAERATEHPKIFTSINIRYDAVGPDLRRDQVEKAVSLSLEKYCPVTAMLRRSAEVTYEITLAPEAS